MKMCVHNTSGRIVCCLLLTWAVLWAITKLFTTTQVFGGNKGLRVDWEPSGATAYKEAQDEVLAEKAAANYVLGNFRPSLEMKEKVDFLLVPALLVQQAISDEVVLTYPGE